MQIKNRPVLLTGIIIILFSSCLFQYEDGPLITFRSKIQRLRGDWNLSSFKIDGLDSLEAFDSYAGGSCTFSCYYSGTQEAWYDYRVLWGDSVHFGTRYWTFQDDYFDCAFGWPDSTSKFAFFWHSQPPSMEQGLWKIKKLSHSNLWFEMYYNNRVYDLQFER